MRYLRKIKINLTERFMEDISNTYNSLVKI